MRFCQSDGTPLVDDAPPVDPYKTMVASSDEIAAAMGPPVADPEPAAKADEEVLQLPPEKDDPKKTMYVSEEELRQEMGTRDEPVVELPPLAPEPPKFSEPSLSPPSFGDVGSASPPPSPFSGSGDDKPKPPSDFSGDPFAKTTPPIPSPFDKSKESTYNQPSYYTPREKEPAVGPVSAPLESAAAPIGASASAPVQNWEPNEPMQNAPVSAGPQGQSKTLAIVSLVSGILGVTLCCGTLLPSLLGIVLGFMAKGKANNDPANFGGAGLALGGIITGALGLLAGIAYLIFIFFLGGMQMIMQNT